MSEQEQQPIFSIEKLYVKDLSLEIPNAPRIFLERDTPSVDVQLHSEANPIEDGLYEVVLTSTVTATMGDKTMFLVEAAQAGVFQIRNIPQNDIEPILGIACPNVIFPYLRETVSDVVTRAGFPPVILNPMNFEAAYLQKQAEAKANQQDEASVTH